MSASIPDGAVVITTKEIYEELKGIRSDLQKVAETLPSHRETLDDHEDRIRGLERAKWMVAGVSAFLGGGGATVIQQLFSKGA